MFSKSFTPFHTKENLEHGSDNNLVQVYMKTEGSKQLENKWSMHYLLVIKQDIYFTNLQEPIDQKRPLPALQNENEILNSNEWYSREDGTKKSCSSQETNELEKRSLECVTLTSICAVKHQEIWGLANLWGMAPKGTCHMC